MKGKDSGENKGFAFVTFKDVELASEAIEKLNKAELNVMCFFTILVEDCSFYPRATNFFPLYYFLSPYIC